MHEQSFTKESHEESDEADGDPAFGAVAAGSAQFAVTLKVRATATPAAPVDNFAGNPRLPGATLGR